MLSLAGSMAGMAFIWLALSSVSTVLAAPNFRRAESIMERATVPSYVTQYAPILYLSSQELYFPSDIGTQLVHTTPEVNYTAVAGAPNPLTLNNLNALNNLGGTSVYLTSKEGIEALPSWFTGIKPGANGVVSGGKTCAVVVADKGNGEVDAFYFYFYAYNQGNDVDIFGVANLGEYGDHVGDWEHTMVRFSNGVPQSIWLSQHSAGEAFTYSAMQKYNGGVRPVVYVGKGTHANWGTSGDHDHTIPDVNLPADVLLTDHTDAGVLYDPIPSSYFYTYTVATSQFAAYDGTSPVNWLYFVGEWGDEQLPNNAPGQKLLFGQAKYSGGPTGPEDKDIARSNVCPDGDTCIISPILTS